MDFLPFFIYLNKDEKMKKSKYTILLYVITFFIFAYPVYSSDKRFDVPLDDSPSLGPDNAPVTIIEFLDYQ